MGKAAACRSRQAAAVLVLAPAAACLCAAGALVARVLLGVAWALQAEMAVQGEAEPCSCLLAPAARLWAARWR